MSLLVYACLLLPCTLIVLGGCTAEQDIRSEGHRAGTVRHSLTSDAFLCAVGEKGTDALDIVRQHIELGADPNTTDDAGYSALMYAIEAGNSNVASFLIAKGARVDNLTGDGVTPLLSACVSDRAWGIRLLVAGGAQINRANRNGTTPLMMAAKCGFTNSVEVLLELGADTRLTNRLGQTSVELAWWTDHHELATRIVEYAQRVP